MTLAIIWFTISTAYRRITCDMQAVNPSGHCAVLSDLGMSYKNQWANWTWRSSTGLNHLCSRCKRFFVKLTEMSHSAAHCWPEWSPAKFPHASLRLSLTKERNRNRPETFYMETVANRLNLGQQQPYRSQGNRDGVGHSQVHQIMFPDRLQKSQAPYYNQLLNSEEHFSQSVCSRKKRERVKKGMPNSRVFCFISFCLLLFKCTFGVLSPSPWEARFRIGAWPVYQKRAKLLVGSQAFTGRWMNTAKIIFGVWPNISKLR